MKFHIDLKTRDFCSSEGGITAKETRTSLL